MKRLNLISAVVAALNLFIVSNAPAVVKIWQGSGVGANGNWNTATGVGVNWDTIGAPANNDDIQFTAASAAGNSVTVNDIANRTLGSITLNNAPAACSIGGSFTLTIVTQINTVAAASNNSLTITAPVAAAGGAFAVTAGGGTITLNGNVTGAAGTPTTLTVGGASNTSIGGIIASGGGGGDTMALTKTGAGTLTLSGANTYNAATTISAGTVNIQNSTALGAADAIGTTVAAGAALKLQHGSGISVAEKLTLNGNGALGAVTLESVGGANTLSGAIALATGTVVMQSTTAGNTLTISGVISGGQGIEVSGASAGTIVFSGANTYTGTTTVRSGGTLNIQNATALGTVAGDTTVVSGGALEIQGGITVGAEALTIAGTGIAAGGALRSISGNNTYGGALTLTGDTTIMSNTSGNTLTLGNAASITGATFNTTVGGAGNTTISGAIATTTGRVTKNDAGTLTLGGGNSFSGGLFINGGTVVISQDSNLGANGGAITMADGTTLQTTQTILHLGNGGAGRVITLNGAATIDTGAFTIEIENPSTIVGAGGLTKIGAGTLLLSNLGGNTYTGRTTITAGTLKLNTTATLATSIINVNGGTFDITTANKSIAGLYGSSTGTVSLGSSTLTITGSAITGGWVDLFQSSITGSGSVVIQNASTVAFTGTSTYTGLTTIQGNSVLDIQSGGALGSTAAGTIVENGSVLVLGSTVGFGTSFTVGAEALSLSGTGIGATGALRNQTGNNTYGGAITIGTVATSISSDSATETLTLSGSLDTNGQNVTFRGVGNTTVSGSITGNGNLLKDGVGTLTLSGNNTYTGTTTVNNGVLNIQSGTALGSVAGNTVVNSGYTLQMQNNITVTGEALQIAGTGFGGTGALLNVSGNNTWNGTITMTGNSTIGSDAGTLTIAGSLVDDNNTRTLTTAGAGNITVSGTIGNIGAITIGGTGTTTFSGSNTSFINGITINNLATLIVQNANALGTTAGGTTVNSGGALAIQGNTTVTALEPVTLNGTGVSAGGAFRSLSGNNTFAAPITVASATRINTDANTLTLSGTINNGTFSTTFGGAGNTTVSGVISNTGALIKDGAGTLTLSGANTYSGGTTINAGVVQVSADNNLGAVGGALTMGSGTLRNTADVTLARNVTLNNLATGTFDTGSYTETLSGVIGGAGNLVKIGAGTLNLSGVNTYTGATTVSAGTLALTGGSLANTAITINSGATMYAGARNIGGSLVNNGNFKAGSSAAIGTSAITGAISGSGNLLVTITGNGASDRINASGAVDITQMTLKPTFTYVPVVGDKYTIVDGTLGSISGTGKFASITSPSLTMTLTYDTTSGSGGGASVILTPQWNLANPALNLSPTQAGVANALASSYAHDPSTDLNTVLTAIGNLTSPEQVKTAYDEITPKKLDQLATTSFAGAAIQNGNLGMRMNKLRFSYRPSSNFGYVDNHGGSWDYNDTLVAANSGLRDWGIKNRKAVKQFSPKSADARDNPWGFFANGSGVFGKQETESNLTGYDFTAAGMTMGVDYRWNDRFAVGLATGYNNTYTTIDNSGGTANVDSISVGPYATYHWDSFYLNTAGSYAHNFYETERNISFPGINRTAKGDPGGNQVSFYAGSGFDYKIGNLTTGPIASLQYSKLWIDSYTETNAGALNLTIAEQTAESLQSGFGWSVEYNWKLKKFVLIPNASITWQHEFSNESRNISSQIAGGGAFQTPTANPHRDTANLACGITALLSDTLSLNLGYGTIVGDSSYTEHAVNGGARLAF